MLDYNPHFLLVVYHPEHPGRILAARLLAADPEDKPSHFDDVMLTGKLCLFSN
jgi:hypothetical protein